MSRERHEMGGMDFFSLRNRDVVRRIFGFLPQWSLGRAARVSHFWNQQVSAFRDVVVYNNEAALFQLFVTSLGFSAFNQANLFLLKSELVSFLSHGGLPLAMKINVLDILKIEIGQSIPPASMEVIHPYIRTYFPETFRRWNQDHNRDSVIQQMIVNYLDFLLRQLVQDFRKMKACRGDIRALVLDSSDPRIPSQNLVALLMQAEETNLRDTTKSIKQMSGAFVNLRVYEQRLDRKIAYFAFLPAVVLFIDHLINGVQETTVLGVTIPTSVRNAVRAIIFLWTLYAAWELSKGQEAAQQELVDAEPQEDHNPQP